jgi:hypothetical protein
MLSWKVSALSCIDATVAFTLSPSRSCAFRETEHRKGGLSLRLIVTSRAVDARPPDERLTADRLQTSATSSLVGNLTDVLSAGKYF